MTDRMRNRLFFSAFFLLVLLSVGGLIAYIIIRRGKLRIG